MVGSCGELCCVVVWCWLFGCSDGWLLLGFVRLLWIVDCIAWVDCSSGLWFGRWVEFAWATEVVMVRLFVVACFRCC